MGIKIAVLSFLFILRMKYEVHLERPSYTDGRARQIIMERSIGWYSGHICYIINTVIIIDNSANILNIIVHIDGT